jgi:outer membrane immunogenic protein
MRRLLFAGILVAGIVVASVGAFVQIAAAADMTVKAAPAPPPPVYSWTGFYIGGNVGASWGNADIDSNADPVKVTTNIGSVTIPGFVGSKSVDLTGIIGGGQIGYNWQFAPNWVAGLEADIQASGEKGSSNFGSAFNFVSALPGNPVVTGTAVTNYEAKILWFGTVRGRIGYAWDRLMLYATGGFAYGEVKLDGTRTVSGTVGGLPFTIAKAIGHSQLNTGWTVGAGVEGPLVGNWTWKLEYLYVDLGSLKDADGEICKELSITSVGGGQTFTDTKYTDQVVRAGLNYTF